MVKNKCNCLLDISKSNHKLLKYDIYIKTLNYSELCAQSDVYINARMWPIFNFLLKMCVNFFFGRPQKALKQKNTIKLTDSSVISFGNC